MRRGQSGSDVTSMRARIVASARWADVATEPMIVSTVLR
jgi:hypothetical protein